MVAPLCLGCRQSLTYLGDRLCCSLGRWALAALWGLAMGLATRTGKSPPLKRALLLLILAAAAGMYWWMHQVDLTVAP